MSNEKTRYQLLVERLGADPALKEKALEATPEQLIDLFREDDLKEMTLDKAQALQRRLKATFAPASASGELSDDMLEAVGGGLGGPCGGQPC